MQLGKRGLGVREEHTEMEFDAISPRCERVLASRPSCWDFRGIRQYVMCKAWEIMEREKRTRLPVKEAWDEARKICRME